MLFSGIVSDFVHVPENQSYFQRRLKLESHLGIFMFLTAGSAVLWRNVNGLTSKVFNYVQISFLHLFRCFLYITYLTSLLISIFLTVILSQMFRHK